MPDEHRLGRSKNPTQFHSSESSNMNGLGCLLFTLTPDDQRCFHAFSSLFRNTDDHLHVESVVLVIVHVVRELKSVHSMLVTADLLDIERCSTVRWALWWVYWADRMDRRWNRSTDDTRSACWTDRMNGQSCNHCCSHYRAERNVREIFRLDARETRTASDLSSMIRSYVCELRWNWSSTNVIGTRRERSQWWNATMCLPNGISNRDMFDRTSIVVETRECVVWVNRRRWTPALHGWHWR